MNKELSREFFTGYSLKTDTVSRKKIVTGFQLSCQIGMMLLLSLCLVLGGCSKRYDNVPAFWPFEFKDYENESVGRFKTSFLAQQIDEYYQGVHPGPIGITTFVNLDDLKTTSSFGRIYGEQLMSELAMRGYDVVELRHADALQFLSNNGEFALSRDVAQVRRERDLGAIIVGTYVVSPVRVYINARLVDPATSKVLSAGSVEMAKTDEIKRLVRGGAFSPTLERIPVKRLGMYTYPMTLNPYYFEEEIAAPAGFPKNPGSMSQQQMMEDYLQQSGVALEQGNLQ
ncbi:hypothetical protein EBR25_02600 [bacterium]|nr:hypothetical protein [bacterium]